MKNKKKIKEGPVTDALSGAINQVFAVQKPYVGCQLSSLVKPIDPLVGLGGSEIVPDSVHAVFPDQGAAEKVAQDLYLEYKAQREQLAEKKLKVVEKIKKTMDELEKQRKQHVEMIKENPGDVTKHRQKVAEIATKLDELVNTLEKVEKSRKLHEEEDGKEETKKKFTYKDIKTKKEAEIEAKDEKEAKYLVNKKGGDVTTVKAKPEEPAAKEEPKEKEGEDGGEALGEALREAIKPLKKSKLSSKEYQDAKKLKDFKASDWKWNKDEQLYIKK